MSLARYEALLGATLSGVVACGSEDAGTTDPSSTGSGRQTGTLIRTVEGPVSGKVVDRTRAFLGIPFAKAPEGPLRWKSPQPVGSWQDPLDATAFGPGCPQAAQGFTAVNPVAQSENCLLLNVWTPEPTPTKAVPVMVWIHGGGFFAGTSYGAEYGRAGDDPYYDGRRLSAYGGVVVVSMGYRLGPFGFLAHPSLAGEDPAHPAAGNYGIEDQRAALEWVQRNAAAFGGDPSNVTLFGESAGGSSVCMHVVSPLSRKLFHRAILESGPCSLFEASAQVTSDRATEFAEQHGCSDPATAIECLRSKSTAELLAGTSSAPALSLPWVPSLDGLNFPKSPFELLAAGDVAHVPTISGTNGDEGTLFQLSATGLPATAAEYEARLRADYGANADRVLALYPASAHAKPADALAAIRGDSTFVCPTRRFVRANTLAGNPTFRYTFTHAGTPLGATLGAFHGSEIRFVFGTSLLGNPVTPEEAPLLEAFQGYWTRLAATGDPNGGGAASWPLSTPEADEHIVLDLPVSSASGLKTEKCDFWDSLP